MVLQVGLAGPQTPWRRSMKCPTIANVVGSLVARRQFCSGGSMQLFCKFGILFTTVFALAGCSGSDLGSNLPRQASYATQIDGQFDDTGAFSANLAIAANYADETFEGVLQNFQFSRRGFERPTGSIPVSGTIALTPSGEVQFKGSGEGLLTQGDREYLLGVEMESSYIDPEAETLLAWYFGGGEFTRAGNYEDWPGVSGDFRAEAACKRYLSSKPCVIPSSESAAAAEPQG